jgi:shikimate dehydrogenase
LGFEPRYFRPYKEVVSDIFQRELSAATKYCAVLGQPINHSASPAMQNAGIAALGLDWQYLAFEVNPNDLRVVIDGAKAMKFVGLNLTVPHKLLAMDMVDALDESAKAWGAVNTIRFEGRDAKGTWRPLHELGDEPAHEIRSLGFNTDADAITRSLSEDLDVKLAGAKVLLLGAGGAGRVAALKLASEGVGELFLVNRTMDKAKAIAAEIDERFPKVKTAVGYPKAPNLALDLLLNATSLGLKPGDGSPLDEAQFDLRQVRAVYDMIYRPAETPLLQAAKAAGCRTANGLGMLLYQGARALELWTGRTAPVKTMRDALVKNIYGN